MASDMPSDIVQEGDQVIIKRDKVLKVFQLRRGRQVWMQKLKFTADAAIGHPYGSAYELQRNKLVKTQRADLNVDIDLEQESGADNRQLTADISNQKLSKGEIQDMKKSLAGEEIVDQLVENSATFKDKTEYSQQKYIKKKKKKYAPLFTVLRPNSRLLAEMYYSRGPAKNLRVDAMAQILTQANVQANSRLMVVESFVGLLVGAVMEKMGGQGTVVHFHPDYYPVRPALEGFSFPKSYQDSLQNFPMNLISTLHKPGDSSDKPAETAQSSSGTENMDTSTGEVGCGEGGDTAEEEEVVDQAEHEEETLVAEGDCTQKQGDVEDSEGKPNTDSPEQPEKEQEGLKRKLKYEADADRIRRRELREVQIQKTKALIEEANMDGLIVATNFHPVPVVMELIDFVSTSRPIVVYSQFKEPLLECYVKLRDRGGVINMRMTETWLREHQVLRDRTHPMVNMDCAGGYLLTAIVVES